jgi:hypothetical protein
MAGPIPERNVGVLAHRPIELMELGNLYKAVYQKMRLAFACANGESGIVYFIGQVDP